jgi:hypothetical protein
MKRWHEDYRVTYREWRRHRNFHVELNRFWNPKAGRSIFEIDCACDTQVGRFRKRHAHECGIPRCLVCHGHKYPRREPTRQEVRADVTFREQLAEAGSLVHE